MIKATFFIESHAYQENRVFDANSHLNRDDCLRVFIQLKIEFSKINIDLSTQDINEEEKSAFVIYNDFIPKKLKKFK